MSITVSCPSCDTSFPVEPSKVPPGGVRAQCSVCPEVFDVDVPSGATFEASQAPEPPLDPFETPGSPDLGTVDLPPVEDPFETTESTVGNVAPTGADLTPSVTEDFAALDLSIDAGPLDTGESTAGVVEAEPPATPTQESPESSKPIRFGRRSPEDKAKSLARSLVSDLIAYNPEKHKDALAAGTLPEVFAEEIEKSLKDYQEQVEPDVMAQGTFFNDALNSILAEGQSVFSLDG